MKEKQQNKKKNKLILVIILLISCFIFIGKPSNSNAATTTLETIQSKLENNKSLWTGRAILSDLSETYYNTYFHNPASDIINENFWSIYEDILSPRGTAKICQFACVNENQAADGHNTEWYVGTVWDIDFDSTRGVMKLYSKDATNGQKTVYASDGSAIGTYIGKLAGALSLKQNSHKIWELLHDGENNSYIIDSSYLANSCPYLMGSATGDSDAGYDEDTYYTALANYYANYKKMSQSDTNTKTESSATVTISNAEYTIVGPFTINFGGQGIASVTAYNASWTSTSSTDIYWCTSESTTASDWSNDFNEETSSGSYTLNNSSFYLAIKTSKLPTSETYTVKIEQATFEYFRARAVSMDAYGKQDWLMWFADKVQTVEGSASWTVNVSSRGKSLILTKYDINGTTNEYTTTANGYKKNLTGAQFVIYAYNTSAGSGGWLKGSKDSNKTFESRVSNATIYTLSNNTLKIEKLETGYRYFIFEVTAPTKYNGSSTSHYPLYVQDRYKILPTSDGGNCSSISDRFSEWVYMGHVNIYSSSDSTTNTDYKERQIISVSTSGSETTVELGNYRGGYLQINKEDADSENQLTGAQFMIYCELNSSKISNGWLSGEKGEDKTYTSFSSADKYSKNGSNGYFSRLAYGTYYIYEVKAPTNYDLRNQTDYMATGKCTAAESDLSGTEYVYCGKVSITSRTTKSTTAVVKTIKNYESGELTIEKQDADTGEGLTGAKFIIYCVTSSSKVDNGWLSGSTTSTKSYGDYSSKKTYTVTDSTGQLKLTKLIYGTYYIYEIPAPTGYYLKYQENYMATGNCTKAETDLNNAGRTYVYCGKVTINKTNKTLSLPVPNEYYANVTIIKKDSSSGKKIEGMGFKIYNNTNGKWLCWNDNGEATGTDRHYTNEEVGQTADENNASIFYTNSSGQIKITHIDVGDLQSIDERTFTVYEVDSENLYYKIDTTIQPEITVTDPSTALFEFTIENTKSYSLQLYKIDSYMGNAVSITAYVYVQYFCPEDETDSVGASNNEKWLTKSGTYKSTKSKIEVSSDDYTVISDILRGTYVIYECQTPTGYDKAQQYCYNSSTGYVECGEIIVGDNRATGSFKFKYEDDNDHNTWISMGVNNNCTSPIMIIRNKKFVKSLNGYVWIDNKDGKADENDSLYYSASNDSLLSGIKVTLYKINSSGDDEAIATTTTNSSGYYSFTRYLNSNPANNIYREVLYWDLNKYYVSFEYDNETYICVDPFATGSNSNYDYDDINSKAQEYSMEQAELEDASLSSITGYAVTTTEATSLTDTGCLANYYNETDCTIENINLGLWVKENPTYSITETLAYAYVTINGFTYIYYYDEPTDTYTYANYDDVPDVMKQVNSQDYVAADHVSEVSLYESDISSTYTTGESNLQVYLVYSIYVYNSETLPVDDVYNEQNLYLTSLTDQYDNQRLELSNDNAGNSQYTGSSQFSLWSKTDTGTKTSTASYALFDGNSANSESVYRNGIDPGETIKTYIQFKVTDNALKLLINDMATIAELNENVATTAYASGFHEYLRTDNVWREDLSYKEYASNTNKYPRRNAKDQNITYATSNSSGDTYFIHKSRVKDVESPALYVALQTGKDLVRTISGVVYEDVAEESTYTYNGTTYTTYVGNGKIDSTETNRAQGVKVELLKASTVDDLSSLQPATLYSGNSETETNKYGEYSFEGVIPGYYYIRFTYGDGTQEIVDTNGNRVDYLTSTDYKSTILDSSLEDAMEKSWPDYDDITGIECLSYQGALKAWYSNGQYAGYMYGKILEWYKYLDATSYNTATDDLNMRDEYNNYVYTEKGIYADDTYTTLIVEYKYDNDGNLIEMVDTTTGNTIATYDEEGNVTYSYNANNSYPFNIQAYTPQTAISIENTVNNYTSGNEHVEIYDDFDFGVVKQPETGTEITKTIDDISIIVQTGSTVVSSLGSKYVSVLDSMQQYIGVELSEETLYGSDVEVTYKVEVENTSQVDYIESENSDDYGTYYKYGTFTSSTTAKTITVNEVIDDIDEKYETSNLDGKTVTQTLKNTSGTTVLSEPVTITKLDTSTDSTLGENTTTTTTSVTFTGWNVISTGESVSITYTVDSLLNASEDTLYTNPARVTSLSLNQLTTLTSSYEWGERSWTEVSVYPSTGGDMRNVLIIAGTIILIVGAFGIILIRKKVL